MSDIKRVNVNGSGSIINPDYDAKLNHTDASLFTAGALSKIAGYNPANGINMQNAVDVLAQKHSNLESKAAYVSENIENSSEISLDISDESGYVLARFNNGHFQTQNFDSSVMTDRVNLLEDIENTHPYLIDTENQSDLDISDEDGNVLARFADGHFQTKEFNSKILIDSFPVELKLDNSSADLDIGDSEGNVILRLQDGHIKTKNFDSQNSGSGSTSKKSIKALFIGNSICQDHVTYLPYLLKNTYGDEIDFAIYIYYIGYCTIKKYATQISTIRAYIFSTAKNTEVWSNNTNNVKLTDALTADDFDIISFQGYFNTNSGEDISYLPQLIDSVKQYVSKPFEVGYVMHQAYNDTVLEADLIGAKTAIKDNPISYFFPCGLATEYAKEFMTRAQLSPDSLHNTEGLPCILGAYTVMDIICKRLGVHTKVIGNPLRLTTEKWQELNIPGPNGSPAQFSDDIWLKCQKSAIRAVNTGEAFFNDAKKAAYNELISVVPIS